MQITGTNLIGATSYRFAGFGTPYVGVESDTKVDVSAPLGAPAGPITIVTNAGSATSTTDFTPVPRPVLLSFSPKTGKAGDLDHDHRRAPLDRARRRVFFGVESGVHDRQ